MPSDVIVSGEHHTLTGDFEFIEKFESRYLPGARDIAVYLPPGYRRKRIRRYPVLYLHDGQNVFDSATSFQGDEWQVDETAEALIAAGAIEPLIVVGIYNTGPRRIDEYTPTVDAGHARGGQSHLYSALIRHEIKPMIDRRFRTRNGPENTGLGGSSLGGLVTLEMGLSHPEVFGKLAVMSPALWWDKQLMLARVAALPQKMTLRIWLDMGLDEGDLCVQDARQMRDLLERKGWVEGRDLQHWEYPGAGHTETAWAARMGQVLQFLFPARKPLNIGGNRH